MALKVIKNASKTEATRYIYLIFPEGLAKIIPFTIHF